MAQSTTASPANNNLVARNLILYGGGGYAPAQDIWQEITGFSTPATPAPGSNYSIYLRPVGLVKRVVLEFSATVTAPGANGLALSALGLQNAFNPVQLYDLSNYQRINTTSWHLTTVSTAKRRRAWGGAATVSNPFGYGNNYPDGVAPGTIAAGGEGTVRGFFEVPLSVNDDDLRGAVYASVTQATMLLQVTINPEFFAAGGDAVPSVYTGSTAGTLSNVSIRVYQNYLDKLPQMKTQGGGVVPILPATDISMAVLMNNTSWSSLTTNTDISLPFVNSREFQSLTAIYDNDGVLNAGSDINYLMINSANLTPLDKVDPFMHSFRTRTQFGVDLPAGMYYWDFRRRPIDTNQSGNTQAVINFSAVTAGAVLNLGWESVAQLGLVNAAGAIPSGG